jgi:outer membrane protein assembly factor BamD
MKKRYFLILLLNCIILFTGCSAVNQTKKMNTDEDYFAKAMNLFNTKNYFDAIPAFEELREKFPLSPYAILAELRLGDSHYFKEEYIEAINYFDNFKRFHPSNQNVPYSIYMAGMCHYKQILSPDRDQTSAMEALEEFESLFDLYPSNQYAGKALCKISEAKERIAEHDFFIGNFYLKKGNSKAALDRFKNILKLYPNAIEKDRLLFYIAKAAIQSGSRQKGKKIIELLLNRYPESRYAIEAKGLLDYQISDKQTSTKDKS